MTTPEGITEVLVYVADLGASNPFGDPTDEEMANITPPSMRLPVDNFTISADSPDKCMEIAKKVAVDRAKRTCDPRIVLASLATDGRVVVTLPHGSG